MTTPLHLVLLAGGQGLRAAGADQVPKQFRQTAHGALFAVSLREFLLALPDATWRLASVTVTVAPEWGELVSRELAEYPCPWQLALPGETRTASTWSALCTLEGALKPEAADLVAIHDAARPFATVNLLDALATAAEGAGGAIPGIPVSDTIVEQTSGAARYLERQKLLAVQTPQVFAWLPLRAAHQWAHESGRDFTDDGGLMAARGQNPAVVPGELANWKVTTGADWEKAKQLLG